jgi:hypothetical protein
MSTRAEASRSARRWHSNSAPTRWPAGSFARGADLSARDLWRNTPLHRHAGSRRGHIGVLIELGADVNDAGASIGRPLHAAANVMNADHAKLLVAAGANVNATNEEGLAPLELALRGCSNADLENLVRFARVLLDAGARRTPMMKDCVTRLGKTFEFHRSNFNPESLAAASAALDAIYGMFDAALVARRELHDDKSPIVPKTTTWQKQHMELWDLLVPSSGPAPTVQGEVIRIAGRIADELERNGGAHWDAGYRAMASAFLDLLRSGMPLDDSALRDCERVVDALVKTGMSDIDRLAELAVAWVLRNPTPMRLGRVVYTR